jgi:hypothetical protein
MEVVIRHKKFSPIPLTTDAINIMNSLCIENDQTTYDNILLDLAEEENADINPINPINYQPSATSILDIREENNQRLESTDSSNIINNPNLDNSVSDEHTEYDIPVSIPSQFESIITPTIDNDPIENPPTISNPTPKTTPIKSTPIINKHNL